jgi:hypothetical protein
VTPPLTQPSVAPLPMRRCPLCLTGVQRTLIRRRSSPGVPEAHGALSTHCAEACGAIRAAAGADSRRCNGGGWPCVCGAVARVRREARGRGRGRLDEGVALKHVLDLWLCVEVRVGRHRRHRPHLPPPARRIKRKPPAC